MRAAVLTVTLNAALDVTYEAERFTWGRTNRVEEVHAWAGGKGVNVARTLARLGVPAIVTGLAGGRTGAELRAELGAAGLDDRLLEIAGESRRTVSIVSRADDVTSLFNEPGPAVTPAEWRAFEAHFAALLPAARLVVLAGSLPRGLPRDPYGRLARMAAARDLPVLVDATGPELLDALAAAPVLVKPNEEELRAVGLADGGALHGARELRRRGARCALVSLGAAGLVAATPEGEWVVRPPRVAGKTTGAGDALVAGVTAGLLAGAPWPALLRRAAAVSAAVVRYRLAGAFGEAELAELEAATEVAPAGEG
jgi:tagatose 6-phosphate kinase